MRASTKGNSIVDAVTVKTIRYRMTDNAGKSPDDGAIPAFDTRAATFAKELKADLGTLCGCRTQPNNELLLQFSADKKEEVGAVLDRLAKHYRIGLTTSL